MVRGRVHCRPYVHAAADDSIVWPPGWGDGGLRGILSGALLAGATTPV